MIFTDVDEFLVPDPDRYTGLSEYLADRSSRSVVAPLALEVVHNTRVEAPLDPSRRVLDQRRFVKYSPGMCKPLVKRTGQAWTGAFHEIFAPFEVDTHLWMFHLKYCDQTILETVGEQRRRAHEEEGRGHAASFWPLGAEKLKQRLASWTEAPGDGDDVPVFDPAEADLDGLIREREDGAWRSVANQVDSLEQTPLRSVPERFRGAF